MVSGAWIFYANLLFLSIIFRLIATRVRILRYNKHQQVYWKVVKNILIKKKLQNCQNMLNENYSFEFVDVWIWFWTVKTLSNRQ